MYSNDEIYKGNTASDFQPPTNNPQVSAANIQPESSGLQQTDSQTDIIGQRLPSTENLKVSVVHNENSSSTAYISPVQTATQTWVGPFWGCVLLGFMVFVFWMVKLLAREATPNLPVAIDEAILKPPARPVKTKKLKPKKSKRKKKK